MLYPRGIFQYATIIQNPSKAAGFVICKVLRKKLQRERLRFATVLLLVILISTIFYEKKVDKIRSLAIRI